MKAIPGHFAEADRSMVVESCNSRLSSLLVATARLTKAIPFHFQLGVLSRMAPNDLRARAT